MKHSGRGEQLRGGEQIGRIQFIHIFHIGGLNVASGRSDIGLQCKLAIDTHLIVRRGRHAHNANHGGIVGPLLLGHGSLFTHPSRSSGGDGPGLLQLQDGVQDGGLIG